jgi:hypothetical protein
MESDNSPDERCPTCGLQVSSLDEPCPYCDPDPTDDADEEPSPYEYFKTFTNRTVLRYRPDEFVATINGWLAAERGLVNVTFVLHRERTGLVNGMTLSCFGIARPTSRLFQFERIPLVAGTIPKRFRPVGEAMNHWKDRNPDKQILRFAPIGLSGRMVEVWVLFASVAPNPALNPDGVKSA